MLSCPSPLPSPSVLYYGDLHHLNETVVIIVFHGVILSLLLRIPLIVCWNAFFTKTHWNQPSFGSATFCTSSGFFFFFFFLFYIVLIFVLLLFPRMPITPPPQASALRVLFVVAAHCVDLPNSRVISTPGRGSSRKSIPGSGGRKPWLFIYIYLCIYVFCGREGEKERETLWIEEGNKNKTKRRNKQKRWSQFVPHQIVKTTNNVQNNVNQFSLKENPHAWR